MENIQILDVLTELGACVQLNGETVNSFCSRLKDIFNRIAKMSCDNVGSLKMAFQQRGFFYGAAAATTDSAVANTTAFLLLTSLKCVLCVSLHCEIPVGLQD